jgi:putative methyltransferase
MSLYWETADLLTAPTNAGGSLKSRIFGKKDLKSQPAQIYALAIETCKWSSVLKEVVENAEVSTTIYFLHMRLIGYNS